MGNDIQETAVSYTKDKDWIPVTLILSALSAVVGAAILWLMPSKDVSGRNVAWIMLIGGVLFAIGAAFVAVIEYRSRSGSS